MEKNVSPSFSRICPDPKKQSVARRTILYCRLARAPDGQECVWECIPGKRNCSKQGVGSRHLIGSVICPGVARAAVVEIDAPHTLLGQEPGIVVLAQTQLVEGQEAEGLDVRQRVVLGVGAEERGGLGKEGGSQAGVVGLAVAIVGLETTGEAADGTDKGGGAVGVVSRGKVVHEELPLDDGKGDMLLGEEGLDEVLGEVLGEDQHLTGDAGDARAGDWRADGIADREATRFTKGIAARPARRTLPIHVRDKGLYATG